MVDCSVKNFDCVMHNGCLASHTHTEALFLRPECTWIKTINNYSETYQHFFLLYRKKWWLSSFHVINWYKILPMTLHVAIFFKSTSMLEWNTKCNDKFIIFHNVFWIIMIFNESIWLLIYLVCIWFIQWGIINVKLLALG